MGDFDNIIGYSDVKAELKRLCDILKDFEKYKKFGITMPAGLLLNGEPGVGKTTMAMSLIEASGRKTFICRKDRPDGEFVNEIKNVFAKAKENAPSIVFLDDMDKFANGDKRRKNEEEYVTIQACIDDIKGSDVFVVATANESEKLPDSLIIPGRFDKVIWINAPKGKDAEDIVKYYLSKKNYIEDLDTKEIARLLDGNSCAELESVINEAGIYAAYDNREKIAMDDLLKAFLRIVYNAPESSEEKPPEVTEMIAYHEAGHAIAEELLSPGGVTLVTIKANHGEVGGFTALHNSEEYWYSKKCMENRVIEILSGKAATEMIYGVTDVGANNDLHRAFDIVERFVDNYCSYGFDKWINKNNCSNDLLSRQETHIASEVNRYYEEAKHLMAENRDYLERVARALIEKKTLSGSAVRALKDVA